MILNIGLGLTQVPKVTPRADNQQWSSNGSFDVISFSLLTPIPPSSFNPTRPQGTLPTPSCPSNPPPNITDP